MNTNITIRKTLGHLRTVITHKYWVYVYCRKLGITWRGITHDLSKFSPVEFWESVRYWDGKSSPIPRCKKDKGFSFAWQHHKGRNTHHYEYWIDNLDNGGTAIKMPWNDLLELIADWMGAGRAYLGKKFTLEGELEWFRNKIDKEHPKIHLATEAMIGFMLQQFAENPAYFRFFRGSPLKKKWMDMYNAM